MSSDLPDPEQLLGGSPLPDFRQERARRSYFSLIDAATTLFGQRGYDGVGTPEISEAAGVAVGTFYRYFEDKHAIYLEVAKRTLIAAYRESLAGLTPELFVGRARTEAIVAALDHVFENVLSRPDLSRSIVEMSLRDPAVATIRATFEQLGVAQLARLIGRVASPVTIPDPDGVAQLIYTAVMESAYSLVRRHGPPTIDAARVKGALALFIERALFPSASTRAPSEPGDPAAI